MAQMEIAVMDRVQNYHTEVDPMAQNLTGLPLQQAILLLMAADYCLSVCDKRSQILETSEFSGAAIGLSHIP